MSRQGGIRNWQGLHLHSKRTSASTISNHHMDYGFLIFVHIACCKMLEWQRHEPRCEFLLLLFRRGCEFFLVFFWLMEKFVVPGDPNCPSIRKTRSSCTYRPSEKKFGSLITSSSRALSMRRLSCRYVYVTVHKIPNLEIKYCSERQQQSYTYRLWTWSGTMAYISNFLAVLQVVKEQKPIDTALANNHGPLERS